MSEFVDPFAGRPAEAVLRGWSRERAVEEGRKLGADEADRRGEQGQKRAERMRRAEEYAAWLYDDKPTKESAGVKKGPDPKAGKT